MKEIFTCFLKTISPIHIGCDDVYEPMGFVIDESEQEMTVFDPLHFISQMEDDDRSRFSDICSKGTISSILEIYKFLKEKKVPGRNVNICQGLVDHYHETLDIPLQDNRKIQQELNRFTIERTSFYPGDQRPYIPGSAIKGALRTAYLNAIDEVKKVSTPRGKSAAKDLEKVLLDGGSFDTDPFRLVKISDFRPIGQVKTRIIYAINEKKRPSTFKARGPYQILEVIEPGTLFQGEVTVDTPQTRNSVQSPISLQSLLKNGSRFFRKEKNREDNELKQIQIPGIQVSDKENTFLIRLGRHSGAEAMTIEGHRRIKIMQGAGQKPGYKDHATTLWLAAEVRKPKLKENLRPFGWAQLIESTPDQARAFEIEEQEWGNRIEAEQEKREIEAERQLQLKQKAAEDAIRKEFEEEGKREEEEKRKAKLEAMSPEERDIAALSDSSISEDQVVGIYKKIDEFSEENKKALALALKSYWVTKGKWKKKDCSKKQWQKVQKVQKILGE